MKKSLNVAKEINLILANEDLDIDSRAQLIQVRKVIEYGETNFSDGLKNSKLNTFYANHIEKISKWLHQPVELIEKRISEDGLTEIESKLVLTNILIELNESKEQEDDDIF